MNTSLDAPPSWPVTVFCLTSMFTLPVYFLVLICLLRLRSVSKTYNSTFYTILLQHCIADLLSMVLFLTLNVGRSISFLREFYFTYQNYYIAAAAYNHIYYTLYIRCTGIMLLTFHRYVVIAHSNTNFSINIQTASKGYIILSYWTLPTLISLVVLKDTNFYYDSVETMGVVAEQAVIQRNTLMALIVVGLTCVLCSLAYGGLFFFIRKNSMYFSTSLRREVSLAIQVFFLLLAFFAVLVYYSFQNYFSQTHNTGPIYYMRGIYPLSNGLLSYINPFCILILNKDLAGQVYRFVRFENFERSEAQNYGSFMNHSIRRTRKETPATF